VCCRRPGQSGWCPGMPQSPGQGADTGLIKLKLPTSRSPPN
jgi:hypothetical protein